MTSHTSINSKDYWEYRFNTNWEENSGRQQTLYFSNLADSLFPEWLKNLLHEGVSFADVGCAEGDGTNFFANLYPNSKFTGIDFSEAAISKAKMLYPEQSFLQADITSNILESFDVVYSSNTLEHFGNPFDIMNHLFKITRKYLAILIPFQEYDRFKEHFYTFDYKDFCINLDHFTIVYSNEIDCGLKPNIFWAGKQLLLIYAHKDMMNNHKITLNNFINSLSSDFTSMRGKYESEKDKNSELKTLVKSHKELITNQQELIKFHLKSLELQSREIENLHLEVDKYKEEKQVLEISNKLLKDENRKLSVDLEKSKNEVELLINEKESAANSYSILVDSNNSLTAQHEALLVEQDLNIEKNKSLENELDFQKKQVQWLLSEKYKLDVELESIKNSNLWSLGTRYYSIRDKTPIIREIFKGLRIIKRHGLKIFMSKLADKIKVGRKRKANNPTFSSLVEGISSRISNGSLKSVVIIPSAFEFKTLYNQRTINLAKFLSKKNIAVLFVVWQWSADEYIEKNFEEVYPNVYQISLYDFFENLDLLDNFCNVSYKKAILNIPAEIWNKILFQLKVKDFEIIYDIMDDWEEFNKKGEASWYNKDIEEAFILNSHRVFAVTETLVNKFNYLRSDIVCNGNGYYPDLLGQENRNISLKKNKKSKSIKLGYFGHLTDSWFDWGLVEEILQNRLYHVEVIGYGIKDDILKHMSKYPNFKYLGKIEPSKLYKYVEEWDIGLIPFVETELSLAVDPIKVYEYIYFGLKVICTGIPHLDKYPNVYCYNNKSELSIGAFVEVVSQKKYESKEELELFINNTTWDKRFEDMLNQSTNFYAEIYNHEKV